MKSRNAKKVKKVKSTKDVKAHEARQANKYRSLVDIGIALSGEKELEKILELILTKAMETTSSDGASIYLSESIKIESAGGKRFYPVLRFHRTSNRTTGIKIQNKVLDIDNSIAGYVATTGHTLEIEDCYGIPESSPFHFNPEYDKEVGYTTKSMLAVPMVSNTGKVRGVLQIINKMNHESFQEKKFNVDDVLSFTKEDSELMKAFASQAAVALENAKLTDDIENLLESFIRASVTAIEARDPSTSGHSDRVAVLTVELARATHRCGDGAYKSFSLSDSQIREIRYAALLHDFGKIGVRESILNKEKKLYPHELESIMLRIESASLKHELSQWRDTALELGELLKAGKQQDPAFQIGKVAQKVELFKKKLNSIRLKIIDANQPQIMHGDVDITELIAGISQISKEIDQNFVSSRELVKLSLSKGSLSEEERNEINSHVSHTYSFLRQIHWTEDLRDVADIAHAHHEKCDGTGYPRGLTYEHIPVQARMMAITDIYDALTSMDRPYKKAVPAERALDILTGEARAGKLDMELIKIFIEAGIFQSTLGMVRTRKAA